MKACHSAIRNLLLPLTGLLPGANESGAPFAFFDRASFGQNPDAGKPRNPGPEIRRNPFPIRQPENHPPKDRHCPSLKKPDSQNTYRKDGTKKPGFLFSGWFHTGVHTLEEHLICGYEKSGKEISLLILGSESKNGAIRYTGHVPLEKHPLDAIIITSHPRADASPFSAFAFMSDSPATWLTPGLACLLQCSEKTGSGLLVTPAYRGLKNKKPGENTPETGPAVTGKQ